MGNWRTVFYLAARGAGCAAATGGTGGEAPRARRARERHRGEDRSREKAKTGESLIRDSPRQRSSPQNICSS